MNILRRARQLYHLTRSTVDASISAGTRVKVLAASARVARLTFTVELMPTVLVGCLVGCQLQSVASAWLSLAHSVVVAALAVPVARRLVSTVGTLKLDVTPARVAGSQRDARTSVTARRAVAGIGRLAVVSVIAIDAVATVRPIDRSISNQHSSLTSIKSQQTEHWANTEWNVHRRFRWTGPYEHRLPTEYGPDFALSVSTLFRVNIQHLQNMVFTHCVNPHTTEPDVSIKGKHRSWLVCHRIEKSDVSLWMSTVTHRQRAEWQW